ncbi:hypothetical protein A6V25_30810 [Nostoc sp. ATCC 53789]|nr:hypothetical protein [Nostoc sp. ATCC 53789]QHG15279.1 hypothetical protein GJB62_04340 [Nostoc sp. ATCC 53789]RCJ16584.1 hypothetical protein A6V25_30810 [Nostoc sp. ATCC 53789]
MKISDIRVKQIEDFEELSANISASTSRHGDFRVWFRITKEFTYSHITGDPFLAGFLIPCMYAGENLHIEAPVSEFLLKNISTIQSILTKWYPNLKEISVSCTETYDSLINNNNGQKGCFFSLGLDSWYSFLKNQDTISHLILIQGADIHNNELWLSTKQIAENIAQYFGKKLITVQTNLRSRTDFSKLEMVWGKYYDDDFFGEYSHGSFLAAIGLCLTGKISEVFIPSSRPYSYLEPWGSHPLLDPLWSTQNLTLIHDGCESNRIEKIKRQVAKSEIALKTLRVCYSNTPKQLYNCCQCEKCLRTMMALRACKVLELATSFHEVLDLSRVEVLVLKQKQRRFYEQIKCEADVIGDKELVHVNKVVLGEKFSLYRFYINKIKNKMWIITEVLQKVKYIIVNLLRDVFILNFLKKSSRKA